MGKAGFIIALMLVTLCAPVVAAQTACVPVVGSCVDVTTDDGVYVCERAASSSTCAVRATADPADGSASYDNIGLATPTGGGVSRNHVGVDGTHVNATSNGNNGRISLDATEEGARFCSITFVGATVQLACTDTRTPPTVPTDPEPVVDAVVAQVNAIRNDPLVRCVLGDPCVI